MNTEEVIRKNLKDKYPTARIVLNFIQKTKKYQVIVHHPDNSMQSFIV
jgi:hypothetical protein